MITSPINLLLFGAVILFAAFLGSWLAFRMNARRTTTLAAATPQPESLPEKIQPPARPADVLDIQHAFDFEEDRVTMILEMPAALLEDDESLAAGWVDVVSWARMARDDIMKGDVPATAQPGEDSGVALDESEITREHLESSLQRLHDAAERRRELRMKLSEKQTEMAQVVAEA